MARELRNEDVWRPCGSEPLPSRWTLSRFITGFALIAENVFIELVNEFAEQARLAGSFVLMAQTFLLVRVTMTQTGTTTTLKTTEETMSLAQPLRHVSSSVPPPNSSC